MAIIHKLTAITAFAAATLYISYSVLSSAAVFAKIASCCYASVENQKTSHTELCCTDSLSISECCFNENLPQDKAVSFSGLFGKSIPLNDMCDLNKYLSDFSFTELSGIDSDEQLHPINITYFIFKPPKA